MSLSPLPAAFLVEGCEFLIDSSPAIKEQPLHTGKATTFMLLAAFSNVNSRRKEGQRTVYEAVVQRSQQSSPNSGRVLSVDIPPWLHVGGRIPKKGAILTLPAR